ncbi:MAG TPA: carbohydrate binding family 9 domain-containing protein, partial [Gemmatimonadales bacterium]
MLAAILTLSLAAQGPASRPRMVPPPTPTGATALRAQRAPVIDGRDDDEVWRDAPAITGFRQFKPKEDVDPSYRTEAKVAYDATNIYVFVRAFDTHPDSILKLLARRDQFFASDRIWVLIDSYHDRRSGFEFGVTPAGVKIDQAVYNDGNEDGAWDAVWEVATTVDSLGWTAEFKIPLSQIRYSPQDTNTFGFAVWRDFQRNSERAAWPAYHPSKNGFV